MSAAFKKDSVPMAEIHVHEHSSPIKTPKQLIIVVVLAFAIPIALIAMLASLVTGGADLSRDNPALSKEAVANRIKPVGTVEVDASQPKPAAAAAPAAVAAAPAAIPAAAVPGAAKGAEAGKGKSVYDTVCQVCHTPGIAGAPKTGDKAAWAPRLKIGMEALYASSIKGKNAMPPKGGNLSLADADVKAAVDYMVGQIK
jgi:cytochrome c5